MRKDINLGWGSAMRKIFFCSSPWEVCIREIVKNQDLRFRICQQLWRQWLCPIFFFFFWFLNNQMNLPLFVVFFFGMLLLKRRKISLTNIKKQMPALKKYSFALNLSRLFSSDFWAMSSNMSAALRYSFKDALNCATFSKHPWALLFVSTAPKKAQIFFFDLELCFTCLNLLLRKNQLLFGRNWLSFRIDFLFQEFLQYLWRFSLQKKNDLRWYKDQWLDWNNQPILNIFWKLLWISIVICFGCVTLRIFFSQDVRSIDQIRGSITFWSIL